MKNIEPTVLVIARNKENLPRLAESDGPLMVPCGSAGAVIAGEVLKGNGQAKIKMGILKMAIDNQQGTEIILDNFELYDENSGHPLLWSLLSQHLKGK